MSQVTDIVLIVCIDDDRPNVERLNRWCETHCGWGQGSGYLKQVDEFAGGGKAMQCNVYMAAVNMLDEERFVAAFRALEWQFPAEVQLLMKGEFDDQFSVTLLDGGR